MLLPLLLAAGLASASSQEAQSNTDTLVVGTLTEPVSLEPHRATDLVGSEIVASVCQTLVRLQPGTLRPEGVLATTWATLDQRSWTLTLREGVRFHDGTLFDADAVVGNVEHLARERTFSGRAERIGPYVVQITLDQPNAALLSTLSQPFFSIQSPRRLEGPGSDMPVGTGPFRLVRSAPGLVELEAFDRYWEGPPRLRRLVYRRFEDADALVEGLRTGTVDVSKAIDQGRVEELRAEPDITLDSQTGLNVSFVALNNERPPFDDPRVRLAVAQALDRAGIVARVLDGHGEPANSPLPPALATDLRGRQLVMDREGSEGLLSRAGLPDGFRTTLSVSAAPRSYLPEPIRLAEMVQLDLIRIGLEVVVQEVSTWADHVGLTAEGDFDMALLGWQADTLDPNDFLTVLLDSGSIGTTNRSRYRSPEMDSLLKRARMESAPRMRLALYGQAQALFEEDMPFVPLYHASVFTARRREVEGLVVGPTGGLRYEQAWKSR